MSDLYPQGAFGSWMGSRLSDIPAWAITDIEPAIDLDPVIDIEPAIDIDPTIDVDDDGSGPWRD